MLRNFFLGSLVDARVVLTAAHCVAGRTVENLRARVGEWDAGRVVFMGSISERKHFRS